MTSELSILGAFLTGLFGSVHCLSMCGGIVTSLSLGTEQHQLRYNLLYHFGRILSYVTAGFIFSGLGMLSYHSLNHSNAVMIGQLFAAGFMLALGLYVSQIWRGLVLFEKAGNIVWKLIAPFANKLLPINSTGKALLAGLLWGWLPCGMVYSALIWSFSSGNLMTGSLIMLAFGLGTLPMLLTLSMFSTKLRKVLQNQLTRWIAGGILISFSVWMIIAAVTGTGHHH